MTTIATDGKSMASDGLTTWSDIVTGYAVQKVHRLKDGRIVGVTGPSCSWVPFRQWLEEGGDKPKLDEEFHGLVLSQDGATLYNSDCNAHPMELPAAIGSGMPFALTAFDCGCSPREAVEAAIRRDIGSGGEVTELFLESTLRAIA